MIPPTIETQTIAASGNGFSAFAILESGEGTGGTV